MEPNEQGIIEAQNRRTGLLFVVALLLGLPLLLAYLFGAWSLAFAAWDLMTAQFAG